MDTLDSDNPLLNDYKLTYVLKLLPQTFLGGAQFKFNFSVPLYIYVVQILLWICPFVIGTVFTLIVELNDSDEQVCALIFGICMLVFHLAVHFVAFVLKRRLVSVQRTRSNFLTEEEEIEFVSFLSMETFEFLIPQKKRVWSYVFHPIICGVVCAFAFMFLLPQRTNLLFGNTVGSWFYFVIGWVTVCSACYPLIGQNPKEPASFRIVDTLEVLPISRSCYVIGFGVFSYAARSCASWCAVIENTDYVVHIVLVFVPFLWLFGVLPPLDALLSWAGEQLVIHLLGGSAMATDGRLFLALVLSCLSVVIFHFIPLKIVAVIVLTSFSLLISMDVCSVAMTIITRIKNGSKRSGIVQNKSNKLGCICYVTVIFVIANVITILSEIYVSKLTSYRLNIVAGLLFVIAVLNNLLCSLQQVFTFFSLVRNPLYSKVCKKFGRMWIVCVASTAVRLIVLPLWLVLTISMLLITKEKHPRSFLSSILMFRAYRMVWQNTPRCTYDILLYVILIWSKFNPSNWNALDPSVQLFIVSMILYFVTKLGCKLWFIFILIFNSQTKKKNHQKKVNTALTIAVCLFPLTLFVVAITTLTTSPLLPLFTLPLFIVGFPRPLRMWPQADASTRSSSKDWIYYQQLTSSFAEEIKCKFRTCGLNTFEAGTYFLARFQDRLIWVTILETGFTHCSFVVKGLELQETSCHSTEAEVVDSIFQSSLDVYSKYFNEFMTSVLTAKFSLDVNAYSDAKNVLTGVIDSPENLETISKFFPKVLLWVLIKHCLHRRKMGLEDVKCEAPHPLDQENCFTARTYETDATMLSREVVRADDDLMIPKTPLVENNDVEESFVENNDVEESFVENNDVEESFVENEDVEESFVEVSQKEDNQLFSLTPIEMVELTMKSTKRTSHKQIVTNLVVADASDDEFGDLGFSDKDSESEPSSVYELENNYETVIAKPIITVTPNFCNILNVSKVIEPPSHWKSTLPFTEDQLSTYSHLICQSWFECVINSLDLDERDVIAKDSTLFKIYKTLVLSCYYIVDIVGVRDNSPVKEGPGHVMKVFYGMFPWSPHVSWIENDEELKDVVVHAYRFAFKLALDNHVLGEITSDEEILEMLSEYEENWFIGEENNEYWIKNVLQEKPNLLSIYQEEEKNVYTSRSLSKQLLEVPIGEVNSECVRGFWSSLSLELYYMTNDDDERYSIQALPLMLRNIITQAADPPLGYPVFSSGLITVHI